MKNIIIALLIGFLLSKAYDSYQKKHLAVSNAIAHTDKNTSERDTRLNLLSGNTTTTFQCDGRTHCSQMTSCDEAVFFLKNCPNVEMDGNHDGEPCEAQWCN